MTIEYIRMIVDFMTHREHVERIVQIPIPDLTHKPFIETSLGQTQTKEEYMFSFRRQAFSQDFVVSSERWIVKEKAFNKIRFLRHSHTSQQLVGPTRSWMSIQLRVGWKVGYPTQRIASVSNFGTFWKLGAFWDLSAS